MISDAADHVRILQNDESLTLILKNTHFTDLDGATVGFRIIDDLPVLMVKFPEPAYNFLVVLNSYELGYQGHWLDQKKLRITLKIMDTVIADLERKAEYLLSEKETSELVIALREQKQVSAQSVMDRRQEIDDHLYRFL